MLNIALFGPPGAGKGTQSEFLVQEYNLYHVSTGDLLRREIANKTRLGLEAQNIIATGGLVSDEIIVQIIEKTITDNPQCTGFLFDGFPRTYVQCYILEGLMLKLNTSLNCLISLELSEEESIARLLNRGRISGRSDDNETVIRNRLSEYKEKTLPVLQFFKEKGIYHEVNGSLGIDEVTESIRKILREELRKQLFNIVLFGYPGSGRGSQGTALARKYGLESVDTGAMLEEEIVNRTDLGKRIASQIEQGELVPDEIVVQLIEKRLSQSHNVKGFIFKGFPRTLVQSYILDGLLRKHGSGVSCIIDIETPMLELISRLDERRQTARCKPYDRSTAQIVRRLKEHETKTVPVIEKYEQQHGVIKIDGLGSVDEVYGRICAAIDNCAKHMR